jgi:hypothetical protein
MEDEIAMHSNLLLISLCNTYIKNLKCATLSNYSLAILILHFFCPTIWWQDMNMVYFILSVFISRLSSKYLTHDLSNCTYILKYYLISLISAKQKNKPFSVPHKAPYSALRCCHGHTTAKTSGGQEWKQLEITPSNWTIG